jgi:hypothetical protein
MNETAFFNLLENLRLSRAGRHNESWKQSDPNLLWFRDYLQHIDPETSKNLHPSGQSPLSQTIRAWKFYFKSDYEAATKAFQRLATGTNTWTKIWAMIGVGKCLTDCLQFRSASQWLVMAAASSRHSEHLDLMGQAYGALGEVLLRAGCPSPALEAFHLDEQLLPSGNRYKGRVACYKAHAYSRIKGAEDVALFGYQMAAHIPGEATDHYVLGGLALLSLTSGRDYLLKEALLAIKNPKPHSGTGWVKTAQAYKQFKNHADITELLKDAYDSFPKIHHLERRWLKHFSRALGVRIGDEPEESHRFIFPVEDALNHPDYKLITDFDTSFIDDIKLQNHNTDGDLFCDDNIDQCWKQREVFMP